LNRNILSDNQVSSNQILHIIIDLTHIVKSQRRTNVFAAKATTEKGGYIVASASAENTAFLSKKSQ